MNTQRATISQYWLHLRQQKALPFLVVLLVLFLMLAVVAHSPGLMHFDAEVTHEVQERPTTPLDFLAYFFTFLGNGISLTVLCIGAALFLRRARRPTAAFFCLLTLLGMPLNVLLKFSVQRPRPTTDLVRILFAAQGSSFPSGHAMSSVIVYGFLGYLTWTFLADVPRRRFWTALCVLTPLGISMSRIYLGVHWFTDVMGAWFFGLVVLFFLVDIYNFIGVQERDSSNNTE